MLKKSYILLCLCLCIGACKSNKSWLTSDYGFSLKTKTDREVTKVLIQDVSHKREHVELEFEESMFVPLKDSVNDLYEIIYFENDTKIKDYSNKFWLQGEDVIIKGNLESTFIVDTVLNSPTFYKAKEFYEKNNIMMKNEEAYDDFLLDAFKKEINDPFSLRIANIYLIRNLTNKDKLDKLYELQKKQSKELKQHHLSRFSNLEKLFQ